MNISFHYFLVKTLAHEACKVGNTPMESKAQEIAYYSQLIDDYNLFDTYIRLPKEYKPFAFFFENNLAVEEKNITGKTIGWKFFPANPGIPDALIDTVKAITVSQETYTLTPFHFIPPKPLTDMSPNERNRYHYQCEKGGTGELLIDSLLKEFRKMEPMQLGMLLHTYADTYAHKGFSGFDMEENNVILDEINDRSHMPPKNVSFNILYNNLAAIGHARLAHVPDAFALSFKYHYKEGREVVERYNMDSFMECARNISDILYQYNGKEVLSDTEWNILKEKLILAGNDCVSGATEITDIGVLIHKWKAHFPDVIYDYDKENRKILDAIGHPAYTPKNPEKFFKFHQYAYEHIYAVTGKYRQSVF